MLIPEEKVSSVQPPTVTDSTAVQFPLPIPNSPPTSNPTNTRASNINEPTNNTQHASSSTTSTSAGAIDPPPYTLESTTPQPSPHLPTAAPQPVPAFSRLPPRDLTYAPFKPLYMINKGARLKSGFPLVLPPSSEPALPHPFADHDVTVEDWIQFLQDIRTAASLTERDRDLARSTPILNIVPVLNKVLEEALKMYIKGKKHKIVGEVVASWNHHFFNPRKVDTLLMQGPNCVGGQFTEQLSGDLVLRGSTVSGSPVAEEDKTYRLFVASR